MNVTAINGSPKGASSNSAEIISQLRAECAARRPEDPEWKTVSSIGEARKSGSGVRDLMEADAVVVAFPLYVDGLPASLMSLLTAFGSALEAERVAAREDSPRKGFGNGIRARRLYGAANCGFFEGAQNAVALEMLANFAAAYGLEWSGGIGIGTGEMIAPMKGVPPQAGIRKPVVGAIRALAAAIADARSLGETILTQHGLPRWLFKVMGEAGWRRGIRDSGLKARTINARPLDS